MTPKQDVDPKKGPQPQNFDYGLIAEDVAEVDPKLAIRDGKGQIESVRYMAIYNILLNEFRAPHGGRAKEGTCGAHCDCERAGCANPKREGAA
jgi:hypothetical protein